MLSDDEIAKRYLNKISNANQRNVEFDLSLRAFINIFKSKKCQLTGIPLTAETITIDRIDNTLGYVSGNVMAVHSAVNTLKATIENPNNRLTFNNVRKMLKVLEKRNV